MPNGAIPTSVVTDHSLHLFYISKVFSKRSPIAGGHHLHMGDLHAPSIETPPWLLKEWAEGLASRYASVPLWQQTSQGGLSRDLLPPVRSLLSGNDPDRLARYAPSDQAAGPLRQLLAGNGLSGFEDAGRRQRLTLALQFSRSAKRRLSRSTPDPAPELVRLRIGTPSLLILRMGVAMLDLPVAIENWDREQLRADVLAEAVKALARSNSLQWRRADAEVGTSFSLGCIARSLLEGLQAHCDPDRRVATCTYVQLEESVLDGDLETTASSLASHQTADYAAAGPTLGHRARPFADIAQVTAPEGSCIAIRCRSEIEFLREYRSTAFEGAYLPLVQLAMLEESALLELMGDAARWPALHDAPTKELAEIGRIRTRAMQYRLAYSFPRVSLLAGHDDWHQALEQQLRLPALRVGLDADMAAIHGAANEAHLRHRAWLESLGGGFISLATAFSVLKDVLASSFTTSIGGQNVAETLHVGMGVEISASPLLAAGVSLIVGVVVGFILFQRSRG